MFCDVACVCFHVVGASGLQYLRLLVQSLWPLEISEHWDQPSFASQQSLERVVLMALASGWQQLEEAQKRPPEIPSATRT